MWSMLKIVVVLLLAMLITITIYIGAGIWKKHKEEIKFWEVVGMTVLSFFSRNYSASPDIAGSVNMHFGITIIVGVFLTALLTILLIFLT